MFFFASISDVYTSHGSDEMSVTLSPVWLPKMHKLSTVSSTINSPSSNSKSTGLSATVQNAWAHETDIGLSSIVPWMNLLYCMYPLPLQFPCISRFLCIVQDPGIQYQLLSFVLKALRPSLFPNSLLFCPLGIQCGSSIRHWWTSRIRESILQRQKKLFPVRRIKLKVCSCWFRHWYRAGESPLDFICMESMNLDLLTCVRTTNDAKLQCRARGNISWHAFWS